MTTPAAPKPFVRYGPLTPQTWPQNTLRVPKVGQPGGAMGHIESANAQRSKQEAFAYCGEFDIPASTGAGQSFALNLATDADGDFWCDQIYMTAFFTGAGATYVNVLPIPSTLGIVDGRTQRSLTYPGQVPTRFFSTINIFSDDAIFDPSAQPLPDGFRSTSTLAQPFCFTRSGAILLNLTLLYARAGDLTQTIYIAFGGWKEYEFASQ
jgi:hypothetical protein